MRILALIAWLGCGVVHTLRDLPGVLPAPVAVADVSSARPLIRKLHLVRPDLIFYPLFIEVYV